MAKIFSYGGRTVWMLISGFVIAAILSVMLLTKTAELRYTRDVNRMVYNDNLGVLNEIKGKLGQSYLVANALAEAEISSEIYSTAGDYDLLVKFYVDKDTDIGHFINEKVQVLPGIQDTHTIITFKAFGSR